MKHLTDCNRCGGNLVLLQDYEGFYIQCILCGRIAKKRSTSYKSKGGVRAA